MEVKKCSACFEIKSPVDFYARSRSVDGKRTKCKACCDKSVEEYRRTKHGLIANMFNRQIHSSKTRRLPLPTYDLEQFRKWALSHNAFHALYDEWVESGYDKMKIPSGDRLDDYKGYSFDNIQFVTWEYNEKKGNEDRKNGINNKKNKSVSQYSIDGKIIKVFFSAVQAQRETGICRPNITKCCSGERPVAGGFVWKYST